MIDERMEEQASLYVLGALPIDEARTFEAALSRNPELQQLVMALRVSRDAMAGTAPLLQPPPGLKQKILARIDEQKKIVPLPTRAESPAGWNVWLPWALAACLAVVCSLLVAGDAKLRTELSERAKRETELNQVADALRNEKKDLQQMVVALQETNRMENLRVALLSSLVADSPKAVAVSLWDSKEQGGVFVAQNLKQPATDKDYQLWVIDSKNPTPVSAGVFQVDANGNVRVQFKAVQAIGSADKFAVTQEPKGGRPTPTLTSMVLIGG